MRKIERLSEKIVKIERLDEKIVKIEKLDEKVVNIERLGEKIVKIMETKSKAYFGTFCLKTKELFTHLIFKLSNFNIFIIYVVKRDLEIRA